MGNEVIEQQWYVERAHEARVRAAEAQEAAEHARKRIVELNQGRLAGSFGPAQAEERRLRAEERLAQVEARLSEARRRSVNAHERTARLDSRAGRDADAERHYDAANDERQVIEDEAVKAAQRRDRPSGA
jgi:hypothetical protein